jgi:hypothetical protein
MNIVVKTAGKVRAEDILSAVYLWASLPGTWQTLWQTVRPLYFVYSVWAPQLPCEGVTVGELGAKPLYPGKSYGKLSLLICLAVFMLL